MPTKTETPAYTVLAEAIVVTTGRLDPQTRKPEIVRMLKGDTLQGPADDPQVVSLLSMRAIREEEKAAKNPNYVLTAREVLRAFRSEVTAEPVKAVIPVDAPNPETNPANLAKDDE